MTAGQIFANVVLLAIGFCIYILPAFVAVRRRHPQETAIFWLNVALGWTFLGWVIALVWACTNPSKVIVAGVPPKPTQRPDEGGSKACPECAETVKAAAKVCRFCGYRWSGGPPQAPDPAEPVATT